MASENVLHLDARLRSAACLVRQGNKAADIGCDHGKLSAVLVCSGRCPSVIAADLREGPLGVARANLQRAGCSDKVELRLGSGLRVLQPKEVQDIVIAGMGAETICEILAETDWVRDPTVRLVLVPATKHSLLRLWLSRQGFSVKEEILSRVSGRCYTAIAAEYSGEVTEPTGAFCLYGMNEQSPLFVDYVRQQLVKAEKYLRDPTVPHREEIAVLLAETRELLQNREEKKNETADGI